MSQELFDKYEELGWKFEMGFGDPVYYFRSPRMKDMMYLCFENELDKIDENKLLKIEREVILDEIRKESENQFEKVLDGLIDQQRLLMEKGFDYEKKIKVSFDVGFK